MEQEEVMENFLLTVANQLPLWDTHKVPPLLAFYLNHPTFWGHHPFGSISTSPATLGGFQEHTKSFLIQEVI